MACKAKCPKVSGIAKKSAFIFAAYGVFGQGLIDYIKNTAKWLYGHGMSCSGILPNWTILRPPSDPSISSLWPQP